ncbi:hypothetical protein [Desulfonema magnum]|nr:hypothetical protein [Desulfonema magnum]
MNGFNHQIVICFALVFLFLSVTDMSAMDDTQKHFAISAICGAGSETFLHYKTEFGTTERVLLGTAMGSIPGLAKELADSAEQGNEFSQSDLTADIMGAFAGAVISTLFNDAIQISMFSPGKKGVGFTFAYNF